MKRGYILITLLFCFTLLFAAMGSAQFVPADCNIAPGACAANFVLVGKVSADGHFDPNIASSEPNSVCCKYAVLGTGLATFNYSSDGHISVNSTLTAFPNGLRIGFGNTCALKATCDLPSGEICITRIANSTQYTADNSHLADCDSGEYGTRLCCKYIEDCTDGADNDGDGFIDCADEDCKQSATVSPQICTNSPYNANKCLILTRNVAAGTYTATYNASCLGQAPQGDLTKPPYFYCSYSDTTPGTGICCQSGMKASWSMMSGWKCVESAPCGIGAGEECAYDFDNNRTAWFSNSYAGDANNWCLSRMPSLFNPFALPSLRSTACCLGVDYGEVGYYTNNNNVKIFGTSP